LIYLFILKFDPGVFIEIMIANEELEDCIHGIYMSIELKVSLYLFSWVLCKCNDIITKCTTFSNKKKLQTSMLNAYYKLTMAPSYLLLNNHSLWGSPLKLNLNLSIFGVNKMILLIDSFVANNIR